MNNDTNNANVKRQAASKARFDALSAERMTDATFAAHDAAEQASVDREAARGQGR